MQPLSSAPRDGALAPPALQIYLLGPPRVEWQSQPLTIPRRQARALLYRLAAEPQPVPRDHLCYLFWPDTGETTARHNLSRLLTILHLALPDPHLLYSREDQIVLDPQGTWSDTRAFDECWVTWCQHGNPACLRAAADLYRGPFLAGFVLPDSAEFDAWVRQAQEFWTRRYLQTLAALSETLTTSGDYAGAVDVVRRYLSTDELAEEMHRRLVERWCKGCWPGWFLSVLSGRDAATVAACQSLWYACPEVSH